MPVCSKIPLLYLLTQKVAQKFGYVLGIKKTDLDCNPELKKSMEQAYAYYIDKRTASFHIDRTAIETSTVLSYDAAVEIVEESLKRINNICKNW